MDWHNWEENCFEWTGDLNTLLWTTVKSIYVCLPCQEKHLISCKSNITELILVTLENLILAVCLWYYYLMLLLFTSFVLLVMGCCLVGFCFRYTTSPHLFTGDAEVAFARVRSKVYLVLVSIISACVVLLLLFVLHEQFSNWNLWQRDSFGSIIL